MTLSSYGLPTSSEGDDGAWATRRRNRRRPHGWRAPQASHEMGHVLAGAKLPSLAGRRAKNTVFSSNPPALLGARMAGSGPGRGGEGGVQPRQTVAFVRKEQAAPRRPPSRQTSLSRNTPLLVTVAGSGVTDPCRPQARRIGGMDTDPRLIHVPCTTPTGGRFQANRTVRETDRRHLYLAIHPRHSKGNSCPGLFSRTLHGRGPEQPGRLAAEQAASTTSHASIYQGSGSHSRGPSCCYWP